MLTVQATEVKTEPYERAEERQNYRNGYYSGSLDTKVRTLTLTVPGLL
ncbi:MAG: transposase [Caldanaerobacter subterraneus]|nr:transposase [Caldanaerobacter subterraneus]